MIVQNPTQSSAQPATPSSAAPSAAPPKISNFRPVAPVQAQGPAPSHEVLQAALNTANEVLQRSGSSLQFTVDRETEMAIVTVVDSETGDVIRQIPSEEALAIARSIDSLLADFGSSCGPGLLCKQFA